VWGVGSRGEETATCSSRGGSSAHSTPSSVRLRRSPLCALHFTAPFATHTRERASEREGGARGVDLTWPVAIHTSSDSPIYSNMSVARKSLETSAVNPIVTPPSSHRLPPASSDPPPAITTEQSYTSMRTHVHHRRYLCADNGI
jgi:hypothetical protein